MSAPMDNTIERVNDSWNRISINASQQLLSEGIDKDILLKVLHVIEREYHFATKILIASEVEKAVRERDKELKDKFFKHMRKHHQDLYKANVNILDKDVLPEEAKFFTAYHWIFDDLHPQDESRIDLEVETDHCVYCGKIMLKRKGKKCCSNLCRSYLYR